MENLIHSVSLKINKEDIMKILEEYYKVVSKVLKEVDVVNRKIFNNKTTC